jgi:CubicO group peptidase (beta-lactamase class C family)
VRVKLFIALVICLFIVQAGWAQTPAEDYSDSRALPEGVKGERIQALIDTLNSGEPEKIRQFLTTHCTERFRNAVPMEGHIEVFLGLFQETGGVDFTGIRTYIPERKGQTVVIVKDRNYDSYRGITLRFADAPEYLIGGAGFSPARPPADLEELPLTVDQFLAETRAFMDRLVAKGMFSGTLLVAKGDKVLLTMAAGEASKAFHVPINIDTKFNLGSMNKMFTSTAVVRLAEKGKLSLDDPISKYIDETWLPKEVTDKITVRHLLTHSSGLGSYFNDTYDRSSRALFRKLDDYKPLIKDDRPAFEPGKRFQYSNTGMFLLGVVIEKVTGEDYFEHIRKVIYEPAGMMNSDCYEMDYPVENLAIGYSPDPKSPYGWQNNLYKHVIKGGPAGGGFSTVKDLHKFALALLGGKYVSKESLKEMWTDHLGASYGYGFSVATGAAGKVVGHGGGFPGINSNLDIYLDSGYIVAVMSNTDRGASPVAAKIGGFLGRVKTRD